MIEICDTCKLRHKVYDDGFDYLSCMLAIKQRDKAIDLALVINLINLFNPLKDIEIPQKVQTYKSKTV